MIRVYQQNGGYMLKRKIRYLLMSVAFVSILFSGCKAAANTSAAKEAALESVLAAENETNQIEIKSWSSSETELNSADETEK